MSSPEIVNILTNPGEFLQFIADNNTVTPTSRLDIINAIALANVGKVVAEQRKLPRGANQQVFTDDLVNSIPVSIFKVLLMVTGVASIVDVLFKFGNQTIPAQAIDGSAFQPNVVKEFNFMVFRGQKINFRPQTATTIELLEVAEFRIGQ